MIVREHYLAKIRPFYDSDLIKIITGVRRCGKSVIKDQIEEELRKKGKPTLSLDFERLSVSTQISNADELVAYVTARLGKEKTYVFLDEVQLIDGWHNASKGIKELFEEKKLELNHLLSDKELYLAVRVNAVNKTTGKTKDFPKKVFYYDDVKQGKFGVGDDFVTRIN